MAITLVEGTATISTTPFSLPNNSTTLTPQTDDCMLQIWVDVSAMTTTEQYQIEVLEKVKASGTQQTVATASLTGVQTSCFVFPTLVVGNGWDVQVTKLAGTDRSISWSLRKLT